VCFSLDAITCCSRRDRWIVTWAAYVHTKIQNCK
jgi:hypothetical protein